MKIKDQRTDKIIVKDRVRTDLGDLHDLEESMEKRGMINPLTVESDGVTLIAGERRLEVARKLGWEDVPVHIWSAETADELLAVEIEENTARKDLNPVEAEQAWQRYKEMIRKTAPPNKGGNPGLIQDHSTSSPGEEVKRSSRETDTRAAKATGYGPDTLRRVQEVREAAEDETEPEVAVVAKKLLPQIAAGELGAKPAATRVKTERKKQEAKKTLLLPGQTIKPPRKPLVPKRTDWGARLWEALSVDTGPARKIGEEVELADNIDPVSAQNITDMVKMANSKIADLQYLKNALNAHKQK